jgi:sulfur relay protein TusB/DsrH
MILHQFSCSLDKALELLPSVAKNDGILLINDGVYWLRQPSTLTALPTNVTVYVLESDASARGITINPPFKVITYSDWVELTLSYSKTVSWS